MTKTQEYICRSSSVLLPVAAFVFFAFYYDGHLHYNEQYQLFLFSTDYFINLLKCPGGIGAWISRFFIQFFLYPLAGGIIYAGLIFGVQWLCSRLSAERSFLTIMASFIPALLLWAVLCKEYAQINLAVYSVICLAAGLFCRQTRYSTLLYIVLTPVIFWICGPACVIFVLTALSVQKKWGFAICLGILILLPFVLRPFVSFDITTLIKGYFYLKDPEISFLWPWICFGTIAAYVTVFSFKIKKNNIVAYCVAAVALCGGIAAITLLSDFRIEEEMVYSNLVRNEKWDEIIRKADHKSPLSIYSIADLNLALAMKGRMGEDMFKYVQASTGCLIPQYQKLHTDNLCCSDIYYHLAMPSASQRHMFECMESIPNLEKGSRMYQRLAQTNSINNRFAASHKYLDALSKTLFYRKWASDFSDNSPELQRMRALRTHGEDYFFREDNIFNELGALYQENKLNDVAFQYAAAYALLSKDLDAFKSITSQKSFVKIPRSYQEAYLLVWIQTHTDLDGLPGFISAVVSKRFVKFVEINNSGKDITGLQKKFGDTYWYYYYYNQTGEK